MNRINYNPSTGNSSSSPTGRDSTGKEGKKGSSYIHLNDIKLHRCVRLGQFDEDRAIMFVPPDGEFELMRYSVSNLSLPFRVHPNIMEKGNPCTRVVYDVKVESKFPPSMYSTDIKLFIPAPTNTNDCNVKVNHGKIKYEPERHVCCIMIYVILWISCSHFFVFVFVDSVWFGKSRSCMEDKQH